jgi:hypothetical protein
MLTTISSWHIALCVLHYDCAGPNVAASHWCFGRYGFVRSGGGGGGDFYENSCSMPKHMDALFHLFGFPLFYDLLDQSKIQYIAVYSVWKAATVTVLIIFFIVYFFFSGITISIWLESWSIRNHIDSDYPWLVESKLLFSAIEAWKLLDIRFQQSCSFTICIDVGRKPKRKLIDWRGLEGGT